VQGPDDRLLEAGDRELLREVTGVDPDRSGVNAVLPDTEKRATQRVGLGAVGGGIVVLTWPGELVHQARRLYDGSRASRLLAAASEGGWRVEMRPHLAYWRSRPFERLYMHPRSSMTADEYVDAWAGADSGRIRGYSLDETRDELWPWLRKRGYAAAQDHTELELFLERVKKANRTAHLRPGLALILRWEREQIEALGRRRLAEEIRASLDLLIAALGDPPLPATPAATIDRR
jgi:hypothetical protein